jgi:hypothetical protein
MKIVIQDATHIQRDDLENFFESSPVSWSDGIDTVIVFGSKQAKLLISFDRKRRVLGVHVPVGFTEPKENLLREIAVTVQAIQEFGHIPKTPPVASVKGYLLRWNELRKQV